MNPPSALHSAMSRERKPFTYTPGGLDLSEIKSERMAKRLMRNAMNEGVPQIPVQQVQSPPATSNIAVPNFNCLPVQVFPTLNLPANPKSLLRTRSHPNQPKESITPKVQQPPQFPKPNRTENTAPFCSPVNNNNSSYQRPTSMYEYNSSPNNSNTLPRVNYGSTEPVSYLPEMSYEAEYLRAPPRNSNGFNTSNIQPVFKSVKPVGNEISTSVNVTLKENNTFQDSIKSTETSFNPDVGELSYNVDFKKHINENDIVKSTDVLLNSENEASFNCELKRQSNVEDKVMTSISANSDYTISSLNFDLKKETNIENNVNVTDTSINTDNTASFDFESKKPNNVQDLGKTIDVSESNENEESFNIINTAKQSNIEESFNTSEILKQSEEDTSSTFSFDLKRPSNNQDSEKSMDVTLSLENTELNDDSKIDLDFSIEPISLPRISPSFETKALEEDTKSTDEQKEVKVVKKQVKKESSTKDVQNGDQNGDSEAQLTVKLPTKKSAAKTETKVEVVKKQLPDGSIEEVKTTITKTTVDGKTTIATKTETTIIPKEEEEEEEYEEEEEEQEEENGEVVVQEVKENGDDEVTEKVIIKKSPTVQNGEKTKIVTEEERSETTVTKKVAVVQKQEPEEEEEEEEEEEVEEKIQKDETKTAVKPKDEPKLKEEKEAAEEEEVAEEEEEVAEEEVVEIKKDEEEVAEEEVEEEEEKKETEKSDEVDKKVTEVEEEYEEAEEKVEKPVESKSKDEESEYTEEEYESEKEEVAEPAPEQAKEESENKEAEKKETKVEEKIEAKEEKPAPQPAPKAEPTVPLREPSIPLEKVEDVEIKPIGAATETITKSHTQNTEIITSNERPLAPLSTQTEYNRIENIVTVNRTTKTLDSTYENLTQQGIPTVKTYFAPGRERISTSPQPSKPYQPVYPPTVAQPQERRHSLLLERLSMERQVPTSDLYQNNYQYNNQTYEQQRQWSQEPQAEVLTVSNVKPSTITNSQWYQQNQSKKENVLYNNVTPASPAPPSQQWNQSYLAPQPSLPPQTPIQPQAQPQPQYQPTYTDNITQDRNTTSTYQQNNYTQTYTPKPTTWGSNNYSNIDTQLSSTYSTQQNQYSLRNQSTTESYQKSTQQYSSSYVPPPWEQDSSYVADTSNQNYYQPPPQTSTFTPSTNQPWTSAPQKNKFSKPPPTAYIPPAPNQSFVKAANAVEPPRVPGKKTYYSEYERRYITVPESNYIPGESKFQPQPDPSPQYYYDNNEPVETSEPQWRKELREFTEKTSQTTEQISVKPPWEEDSKYAKPPPSSTYTPTPTWSQTLRPNSHRERSFESEYVSQDFKTNTLGRGRPLSTYAKSNVNTIPERVRSVSVDRYNPNSYVPPPVAEHPPVQSHTLNVVPPAKSYHNPNVPAYHAQSRASAEPREQPIYPQPRQWAESRASPLQSRSFKYLQWITGTED